MNDDSVFEFDFEDEVKQQEQQPNEDDKILKVAETVAERVARAIMEQQNAALRQQQQGQQDNRLPEEVELEQIQNEIAELDRRIEEEFQRDPNSANIAALQLQKLEKQNRMAALSATIPLKRELMQTKQFAQQAAQVPVRVNQLVAQYREHITKKFPPNRIAQIEAELHQALMNVGSQRPEVLFDDAQIGQLITLWISQKFAEVAPPYDAGMNDWGAGTAVRQHKEKQTEAELYEVAKQLGLQGEEAKQFVERVMADG